MDEFDWTELAEISSHNFAQCNTRTAPAHLMMGSETTYNPLPNTSDTDLNNGTKASQTPPSTMN
eukprot:3057316-Heterocapsa_arctica.AAC.1